jgi:hypothetical protein
MLNPKECKVRLVQTWPPDLLKGNNAAFWFDYNTGVQRIASAAGKPSVNFPEMTEEIRKASPMSLWNVALELHTGRVFEHLIGPFYILIVPIGRNLYFRWF